MNNEELTYNIPVQHLSYSALKMYCANRSMFKKRYILQDYEFNVSPALMIGKMGHRFAEALMEGLEHDEALEAGYAVLDGTSNSEFYQPNKVDREAIKKKYATAVRFFTEEMPEMGTVLDTEISITADFVLGGKPAPLPVKAVTDLVTKIDDEIHMWDYKFTSKIRDSQEEQPDFILQSVFNRITVGSKYKKQPKAMHFVQVKISANQDKSPQVVIYTVDFDKHPEYMTYFDRMYRGFIKEVISPHVQFLPNFSDYMNGQEAWEEFTTDLHDFNLPKNTDHSASYKIQRNKNVKDVVAFIDSKSTDSSIDKGERIMSKLLEFGINLKYKDKFAGANITLFTFEVSRGVSMNNIKKYEDDLQLVLGVESVVVHAPLRGQQVVGVEVSNEVQEAITFDIEAHKPTSKNSLEIPVGVNVYMQTHYLDIANAPHLLIAGATGMGKSVFLNTLLTTILNNNTKGTLEVILIDPKGNEFFLYEDDSKVIGTYTEIEGINGALKNITDEMRDRYAALKKAKVRDIDAYNAKKGKKMPKWVIVVDELADLILSKETYQVEETTGEYRDGSPKIKIKNVMHAKEIENSLIRLAQKARAVGIHLVCATQRPSTDVVLGVLKANFPTRIAFATVTSTDSQVILDQSGAEKLIGNGDLLLMSKSSKYLERLQGFYI